VVWSFAGGDIDLLTNRYILFWHQFHKRIRTSVRTCQSIYTDTGVPGQWR